MTDDTQYNPKSKYLQKILHPKTEDALAFND